MGGCYVWVVEFARNDAPRMAFYSEIRAGIAIKDNLLQILNIHIAPFPPPGLNV